MLFSSFTKQIPLKTRENINITRYVTKENIQFRLIIDQTGTYTHNAVQVISNYLKPLCENNSNIFSRTFNFTLFGKR